MGPLSLPALLDRLDLRETSDDWQSTAHDAQTAWATARRADLLVQVAERLGVDRPAVVRAAARVLELALPLAVHQPIARRGWEIVMAWTRGVTDRRRCQAVESVCTHEAARVMRSDTPSAATIASVATLAAACDLASSHADWAREARATESVRLALLVVAPSVGIAAADVVRRELPWPLIAPLVERLRPPKQSGVQALGRAITQDMPTPMPTRRKRRPAG